MAKIFDRLAAKIEKELGLKARNFQRMYSSRYQLEGFANSWTAELEPNEHGVDKIASSENATFLLEKKHSLSIVHVDEMHSIMDICATETIQYCTILNQSTT